MLAACAGDGGLERGLETFSVDRYTDHVRTLASDEFEGRSPSSAGEERTLEYLSSQFEEIGLQPGNGSSFFQEVPLVSITANPNTQLRVRGDVNRSYLFGEDFVAVTRRVVEQSELDGSELVFVGYGIVAPEFDWNDYQGVDVTGKTVVILVNDPGYATEDQSVFNGRTMTYYGRWTYKYEEAARQGAAGALVIHETGPAGYGWQVVNTGWRGPQFHLVSDDNNMSRTAVEGWIQEAVARELFAGAGLDYDELKSLAAQPGFQAVTMGSNASLTLQNTITRSSSSNVLAVWEGSERADEYIIYTAHWDHLGTDPSLSGDQIYNGAQDNATGTAGLLELARAYAALPERPLRSVLFLAVTAEEQGLLGSAYYATHPVYPLDKTVAVINLDALNIHGPMNDITVVGLGNSELDDYVREAAAEQARVVNPDPEPEKGFFYRSDQFSFAKEGVPSLYLDPGVDHVEFGEEWTLEQRDQYTAERYHQPGDEFDPSWDLSGAIQDLKLVFRIGYRLTHEETFPNWHEGNEFRAIRDAQMGGS